MDIVIPCRPGPNQELRYALRSIAAHLPHDRIWIIGSAPDWVNTDPARGGVGLIRSTRSRTKYLTTTAHVHHACTDATISDPFVLANDDMFVTEPLPSADAIPFAHAGPIADLLARYRRRRVQSEWLTGMRATLARLRDRGFDEPLSYELHLPMLVHKAQMLDAILMGRGIAIWCKRSAYGAIAERDGVLLDPVRVSDVKVHEPGRPLPAGPFVSSSDRTFASRRRDSLGATLRTRFPEPCQYEQAREFAHR